VKYFTRRKKKGERKGGTVVLSHRKKKKKGGKEQCYAAQSQKEGGQESPRSTKKREGKPLLSGEGSHDDGDLSWREEKLHPEKGAAPPKREEISSSDPGRKN